MFIPFIAGPLALGAFVLLFHLIAAAPTSAGYDLQRRQSSLPSYVLEYGENVSVQLRRQEFSATYVHTPPILWLCSTEAYMPSDIASQLSHTIPEINGVLDGSAPFPLTLDNLNSLNGAGNGGVDVYLTSKEGIQALPVWLNGVKPDASHKTEGVTSCAIITVDKGSGLLDAFYFYFYAYNQGDWVLNLQLLEFGDHVGDWEHNMIRFQNGVPQAVWFSQHADGEAFSYAAVEKQGVRPVVYVANGTHANYGTSGTHDHTIPDVNLPGGPLEDHCDQGTLWDPTLSAFAYSYGGTFTPYSGSASPNWLSFTGHWGDAQLPDSTPGQVDIFGEAKYVGGPTGPIDKVLNRTAVCPNANNCLVRPILTP